MDNNTHKHIVCNLTMGENIIFLKQFCKDNKLKGYTSRKSKQALFDFMSDKFTMVPIPPTTRLRCGKYVDGGQATKKSVDTPVDTPVDTSDDVDTPVDKPVDKPDDKPVDKPVDTPVDKPVDTTDYKTLYLQSQKDLKNLQDLYDKLKNSIKTPIDTPVTPPTPPKSNKITIQDYSEKSIVILGDTKPIKDLLKSNKCKYNPHLKCGPGWLSSKKQIDNITKILKPYM